MRVLSWNVQCARGVDDVIDVARIADVIREWADPDVICLQEVARHMGDIDGGEGADQLAQLSAQFPGYTALFGSAIERRAAGSGRWSSFGNLILSRLPVIQVFRHMLPQPPEPGIKQMPRQATEAIVLMREKPIRVLTTHLEYHSERQRCAQTERLRILHSEICGQAQCTPLTSGTGPYASSPRPPQAVICGDFNFLPEDAAYRTMTGEFGDATTSLIDAWRCVRGTQPHPSTCGVFDRVQWTEGPHCRDYFFVSEDLSGRVADVAVNGVTEASDHQPMLLELHDV